MSAVSAAIYIRVSTEEQTEGWSLEAQRELCKRLALQRGWSVYRVYEEPGQSAKTDRRPVFQQMLRAGNATANLVSDAHLAALAVEHNCVLYSTDTDFARFRGLKWKNPVS